MLLILHLFIPIIELLYEELYHAVIVYIYSTKKLLILKKLPMACFTYGKYKDNLTFIYSTWRNFWRKVFWQAEKFLWLLEL